MAHREHKFRRRPALGYRVLTTDGSELIDITYQSTILDPQQPLTNPKNTCITYTHTPLLINLQHQCVSPSVNVSQVMSFQLHFLYKLFHLFLQRRVIDITGPVNMVNLGLRQLCNTFCKSDERMIIIIDEHEFSTIHKIYGKDLIRVYLPSELKRKNYICRARIKYKGYLSGPKPPL